ncbi:MAG: CDP-glycerol glycerophosphotransferase family protein [Propionicimonas sp.]|uniref:CDP-glycerol glycerophosphotransferase family protein n=1 Tax=Propionicimonas sp. TaxID=1955623 RepID=UPI003D1077E9
MSDEESPDNESEDPKAVDAAQIVRMPQHFDFARAVLGTPQNPAWLGWLDRLLASHYLAVTAVLWGLLALDVLLGWVEVGAVVFVLAVLIDWLASRTCVRDTLLLRRLAVPPHVRQLIRGVLLISLLVRGEITNLAVAVAAVVLALQLAQQVLWVGTAWLSSRQPALAFRTDGSPQPEASVAFATAYRFSSWQHSITVAAEVLIGVWAGLAFGRDWALWLNFLIAAVTIGVLGALAVRYALTLRRLGSDASVERIQADVTAELDANAPEALVYMSADAGQSQYILNQWVPAIEALHQKSFIMVREASHLAPIAPTPIPVVYAPKTRHVEELTRPSTRVAYYLANAGKNVHLLREASIRHVFLNHGDSDKSTSANPVSRVYDGVWVAGQAAIDRYEAAGIHMPASQYAIIGRPQVEGLHVGPVAGEHRPTILYAPTFEGYYEESNYSSLERMGPQMIRRILELVPDVRIVFKPHPASGVQRPGMAQARVEIVEMLAAANAGHLYVGPEASITLYECFDMADALVSDISSVVTDFLYTERPLITSNPRELDRDTYFRTFPTQRASYILEQDLSNLSEVLTDALGEDSLKAERLTMKHYVLGDLPAGPTAAFVAEGDRITLESAAHAASIKNEFRVKS